MSAVDAATMHSPRQKEAVHQDKCDQSSMLSTNTAHRRSEDGVAKPLICSFFKRFSTSTPFHAGLSGASSGGSSLNSRHATGAAYPPHEHEDGSGGAATPGGAGASSIPPYPPPLDDPVDLFPLTPSVNVPLRRSKRSGRVLNESETLQEKHAQEYRYIVPVLAYAIQRTTAEHDIIRQNAGLPAYVSPSPSPDVSPTRSGRAGATDGSAAAGGTNNNSTIASSAFQIAMNSFSTREVPAISVHDYLKRVVKYTYVSPSVLVCSCMYLDRLLAMYPSFLLHPYNVFKFLIAATRVCSKIMDTRTLNNRDFSVVGGVANDELNALEFLFVQLLQNRLYISRDTFNLYCEPLRRQAAHMDVESEWDGTVVVTLGRPAGGRPAILPNQPTRRSFSRGGGIGAGVGNNTANGGSGANGSMSRSRRSSIMSQSEYSVSLASQSGVSPLRSASRPAFPPSASTGQSISIDTESLGVVRQASGDLSRGGSASMSARRYPMGTTRSPVLPQVRHATSTNGTTTTTANANNAAASTGFVGPPPRPAASASANVRSSDESTVSAALAHNIAGTVVTAQPHQPVEPLDVEEDQRARSIPLPAPYGAAASWDAAGRASRNHGSSTGGNMVAGLGASVTSSAPGGPFAAMNGNSGAAFTKAQQNGAASAEGSLASPRQHSNGNTTTSGGRTPLRRSYVASTRAESVTLPPVPRSGRRGRSASLAGSAGVPIQPVPPAPEFRQRQ